MKNSILIIFLAIVGFWSCQDDNTAGENTTTQQANSSITTTEEIIDNKDLETDDRDPFPADNDKPTPQKERVKRVLTSNYWVNTAYFKSDQPEKNRENQGNWYKFNEDGTFTFGHFEEELASGFWKFDYVGKNGQVHLKSKDTQYSGLWSIKIGSSEDIMIWVGTETYKTNGVQQRFENLIFIPKNREELGLSDVK